MKKKNNEIKKKLNKRLFLNILVVISILIIFTEIFLRFAFYEQLKTRINSTDFINDTALGYMPIPNSVQYLVSPSVNNKININSEGFYGKDFNPIKAKGVYRIIMVGGSEESGTYTESNKSFVEMCNEMFKKNHLNVEVINCSYGGTNRDLFKIKLIERKVINYNPDLIILGVAIPFSQSNEARENYKGYLIDYDKSNQRSEKDVKDIIDGLSSFKYSIITGLYDLSYIFRAICKKTVSIRPENLMVEPFVRSLNAYVKKRCSALDQIGFIFTKKESLEIIEQTSKRLKEKGIDFRLLLYNNTAPKFSNNFNIKVLQLKVEGKEKTHLQSDGHMSDFAHKELAKEFYDYLINNIIPANYLLPTAK